MATKGTIAIMVEGGLVQSVHASKNIADLLTIEVYDLDEPGYMTDEEGAELRDREKEFDKATKDMTEVY